MKHQVNYKEIARQAGVSVTSVHFALRNKPGVSAATREHILKVAGEQGYRTNPFVTALMAQLGSRRKRKLKAILALFSHRPMESDEYIHSTPAEFFAGARDTASGQGFLLEPFLWRDFQDNNTLLKRVLRSRQVSGALFHLGDKENIPAWCDVDWNAFGLASVGDQRNAKFVDSACSDHYQNTVLAFSKLSELGHTRIGLISTLTHIPPSSAGASAIAAFLLCAEVNRPARERIPPLLTHGWHPDKISSWLKRHRPTAILTNDHLVLDWLAASPYRVPADISYAHLDLDTTWHGVSGIRQHNFEVGAIAMQCVIDHIYRNDLGFPGHPKTMLVQGSWVDGTTTAPLI